MDDPYLINFRYDEHSLMPYFLLDFKPNQARLFGAVTMSSYIVG